MQYIVDCLHGPGTVYMYAEVRNHSSLRLLLPRTPPRRSLLCRTPRVRKAYVLPSKKGSPCPRRDKVVCQALSR